jgi:hypothetical protein
MGNIPFNGCNIVADFALTCSKAGRVTVVINGFFDFGFVLGIGFGHGGFDFVDYLDANCVEKKKAQECRLRGPCLCVCMCVYLCVSVSLFKDITDMVMKESPIPLRTWITIQTNKSVHANDG